MHSQRRVIGTLVSSIVSQALAIVVLLLSSDNSLLPSSFPSPTPPFPSPPLLLIHHVSFLLLFLATASSSPSCPSSSPATTESSSASSSSASRTLPLCRKRKRKAVCFEIGPQSSGKIQRSQRLEEEEGECGDCDGEEGSRSFSSSSSHSSFAPSLVRRRIGNTNIDVLPLLEEPSSFCLSFRMTRTTFEWLSGLLEPLLECRDPAGASLNLNPHLRLGIGLFRLGTGSPYSDVASRFSVSESTARFCTKQLCRVLCTNFRFWVAFPNPAELRLVSDGFRALCGLPNCCGVLQCARFEARGSEGIVTQFVVDSALRILNIAAGFRRSRDESSILRSSALYKDVQGGHLLGSPLENLEGVSIPQYLIGCAAHPLLPWLMVPFPHPVCPSPEDDFNTVLHNSARRPALQALASLKNWGILRRPIEEEELNMAVACIGACSILHNVLLMREDLSALSHDDAADDCSLQSFGVSSTELPIFKGTSDDEKASGIRNALAKKARDIRANPSFRNEYL